MVFHVLRSMNAQWVVSCDVHKQHRLSPRTRSRNNASRAWLSVALCTNTCKRVGSTVAEQCTADSVSLEWWWCRGDIGWLLGPLVGHKVPLEAALTSAHKCIHSLLHGERLWIRHIFHILQAMRSSMGIDRYECRKTHFLGCYYHHPLSHLHTTV